MGNNQQQTLDDILEIVSFLKDNGASKEDLKPLVTKDEFHKEMDSVKTRLNKIEATMVTKDYLDEKLGDVKGDIIAEVRHEDKKLAALIAVLRNRNVISLDEAKDILGMKPFPQISLS